MEKRRQNEAVWVRRSRGLEGVYNPGRLHGDHKLFVRGDDKHPYPGARCGDIRLGPAHGGEILFFIQYDAEAITVLFGTE